ncbi:MAG: ScpA family protein [Thermaerobacter sp.]|nr:ScpA family protein [Thermaerobacter sp.]MDA8145111.1 ScpA family protein [Thermaerobacter sp.]
MNYRVRLEVFEGPLDLLLYLVEEAQLDIHEVSLVRVTDQFLEYLAATHDVEQASRFLVVAAQLMAIKARSLLPLPQAPSPREEEDPGPGLARRLAEYRQVRRQADLLATLWARESFLYPAPDRTEGAVQAPPVRGTAAALARAMAWVLGRAEVAVSVPQVPISVTERLAALRDALEGRGRFVFQEVMGRGRGCVVGSFLALLELWRTGEAEVRQEEPFGAIQVWREEGA